MRTDGLLDETVEEINGRLQDHLHLAGIADFQIPRSQKRCHHPDGHDDPGYQDRRRNGDAPQNRNGESRFIGKRFDQGLFETFQTCSPLFAYILLLRAREDKGYENKKNKNLQSRRVSTGETGQSLCNFVQD